MNLIPARISRDSGTGCEKCGKAFARKHWEKPNEFSRRRYCGRECELRSRALYVSAQEILLNNIWPNSNSGCWEWQLYRDPKGYGRTGKRWHGEVLTHRISYREFKGEIPHGLMVLHSCDNPRCINPDHLRVGTAQDNTDDRVKRHRCARMWGPANPNWLGGRHSRLPAYQVANDQ